MRCSMVSLFKQRVKPLKLRGILANITFKYVLNTDIIWAVLNFVLNVIQAFAVHWAFQDISWGNVCVVFYLMMILKQPGMQDHAAF